MTNQELRIRKAVLRALIIWLKPVKTAVHTACPVCLGTGAGVTDNMLQPLICPRCGGRGDLV